MVKSIKILEDWFSYDFLFVTRNGKIAIIRKNDDFNLYEVSTNNKFKFVKKLFDSTEDHEYNHIYENYEGNLYRVNYKKNYKIYTNYKTYTNCKIYKYCYINKNFYLIYEHKKDIPDSYFCLTEHKNKILKLKYFFNLEDKTLCIRVYENERKITRKKTSFFDTCTFVNGTMVVEDNFFILYQTRKNIYGEKIK